MTPRQAPGRLGVGLTQQACPEGAWNGAVPFHDPPTGSRAFGVGLKGRLLLSQPNGEGRYSCGGTYEGARGGYARACGLYRGDAGRQAFHAEPRN